MGLPKGSRAAVRDLFAERDLGEFLGSFTAEVDIHDVMVLKLMPEAQFRDTSWRPWHNQPMFRSSEINKALHRARPAAAQAGDQPKGRGRQIKQFASTDGASN